MTKQELKKLMDAMASTPTVEKMTEAGTAMSTYMIEHPEDAAEIMEWFTAAQQGMMSAVSETSAPTESKSKNDNFQYVFTPSPIDEEFEKYLAWTYDELCGKIEKLKADDKKLKGLVLHTSGEPGFFDIQGWEMEDGKYRKVNGKYLGELFMCDFDEESENDDDYDEETEVKLFEAKKDTFAMAIANIHKEGKWADIIDAYPFTIHIEYHDDGADTEFLIINNEQGAKPTASEVAEALKGDAKRRTAEDFYNDILSRK